MRSFGGWHEIKRYHRISILMRSALRVLNTLCPSLQRRTTPCRARTVCRGYTKSLICALKLAEQVCGKKQTDFIPEAIRTAVGEALIEKRIITADPQTDQAFRTRLDQAPDSPHVGNICTPFCCGVDFIDNRLKLL